VPNLWEAKMKDNERRAMLRALTGYGMPSIFFGQGFFWDPGTFAYQRLQLAKYKKMGVDKAIETLREEYAKAQKADKEYMLELIEGMMKDNQKGFDIMVKEFRKFIEDPNYAGIHPEWTGG